jgi:heterodisulfide reductase subunit C
MPSIPPIPEPKRQREAALREAFLKEVAGIPAGEKIKNCIQCGTCTGSCPVSHWMDITPRETVALFRAGMLEEILESRTIWICASCYSCKVRCPMGIEVTDLLYALKRLATHKKIYPRRFPVHALSDTFISSLYRFGRIYEMELGLRYFLKTHPLKLLSSIGFGLSMIRKGRMAILPKRIKKIHEVKSIVERAKELEGV